MTLSVGTVPRILSCDSINIAELLNDNYVIICDTNVFLGPYRFSPDYANFTVDCLRMVQNHIMVPYTVFAEFRKHNRTLYARRKDKIENSAEQIIKLIDVQKIKMGNSVETLVKRQFPETDSLKSKINEKYIELKSILDEYFENWSVLNFVSDNHNWDKDIIELFMNDLELEHKVMKDFPREEIYKICEEGKKRYKDKIPPGYKDSNNKDGLSKYSDLILWKEIINYAYQTQKNIIFVTDDVKPDWWNIENGEIEFLPKLIEEFCKSTKRNDLRQDEVGENTLKIIPFVSKDFYEAISTSMNVEKSDVVEQALQITESDYIDSVQEEVILSVIDELKYSELKYIDESTMTYIGSTGIDEWELSEINFDSYVMVEKNNGQVTYDLTYEVVMESSSYDYFGKDSDTKEIIFSDAYEHTVKGLVTIQIVRIADIYTDFEDSDEFSFAEIVSGSFAESSYSDFFDREDSVPGAYTTCPDCGRGINNQNDGGNGFCSTCGPNH